jgi:REP element-mobilizing transposase RayT
VRGEHPQHVTTRVRPGLPNLRTNKAMEAVRASLRAAHKPGFRVVHFSVMRNHLHFIVEADSKHALAAGMKGLQVRMAKALNRAWGRRGSVFSERYHVRALSRPGQVRHGLAYVLNNARRHAAAAGHERPARWVDPCSSARQFDGWRQRVRREPGVVAAPRTWLLSGGWRRGGGSIDAHHVPG